jgi:signal transduction histidine kinase
MRGNLWMSCNRGIYRVRKEELNAFAAGRRSSITSIAYGKADGMLSVECNGGYAPAGVRALDGKLWFPTAEGVAVIDPAVLRANPLPPPVIIESTLIDHTKGPLDGTLRIAPGHKNLEIEYTAPSFINSDQIRFRYRMEGLDSDWVDAGVRRTAYYSHLPPGKYRFKVIAGNSDGVWNTQGQSIAVIVAAPWYRTWWFAAMVCLLLAAGVMIAWRSRGAELERRRATQEAFARQLIASQENERKRIAAELHDTLGQRLVVIKNLALFQADAPPGDLHMVDEISAEASLAIRETKEISFNLRPFQLDRLGLTKAIEAILKRLSAASGIHFSFEYDEVDDLLTEEVRIGLYRIVQEALNNVVKHAQAKEARIRIRHQDGHMLLRIEDDGRGFTQPMRPSGSDLGGFGLTGMAERAMFLGGEFKVRSAPGHGAVITIEVPIGVNGRGR